MTAVAAAPGLVVRDLGDHGYVTFQDGEGRKRAYHHKTTLADKGRRLTSVTTVLGCLEKRALYAWHEAKGAEGAVLAARAGELDVAGCEPSEAIQTVRALGLGADAAKKQAADRGLDVHGALELWATTGALPAAGDLRMDARPYLQGLARWLLAADPVPVKVEEIVCHPDLGYAGRYDLLADIGGVRALVDLKTSRSGRPYPEAHTQLRAYWQAENAVGVDGIDQAFAVGVSPDGGFAVESCCAPVDAFEKVLAVYRLRLEIDREVRAMRKETAGGAA